MVTCRASHRTWTPCDGDDQRQAWNVLSQSEDAAVQPSPHEKQQWLSSQQFICGGGAKGMHDAETTCQHCLAGIMSAKLVITVAGADAWQLQ